MYETMMAKMVAWNEKMNGIPRKCLLITIVLLAAGAVIALFPFCWPFMVALVFSMALEPFVRVVSGRLEKVKMGRTIATLIGMVVLFGIVAFLTTFAVQQIWRELMALVRAVPSVIAWIRDVAVPWVRDLYLQYQDVLPSYVMDAINNAFATVGQELAKLATTLSALLTTGAWATAMSVMDVVLAVVLTIMGTFYLTADKVRIMAFFQRTFPVDVRRHSALIKTNLVKALFGQLKSQINVSLIIITFLILVFVVFGVPYGFLAGLIIGIADALPVIGAGLFLIPWSIVSFVLGDVQLGLIMALTYVGTIVVRQVFEPRIVGKNLGLYPLATMIAMFAGYRALGFIGLLGGPVMLNVIKVVLEADRVVNAGVKDGGEGGAEENTAGSSSAGSNPATVKKQKPKGLRAKGKLPFSNGKKRNYRKKA